MPRLCLAVIVIGALSVLAGGCRHEATPPAGDVAASLSLPTLDGQHFDPTTLRGKPAVVLFWRVGCSYCMHELPVVAEIARSKGVSAVAVMIAGSTDKAKKIAADFDGTVLRDDGSLRKKYGIDKVPYTLVLRGDGTAAHAFIGEQSASTLGGAIDSVR